MPPLSGHGYPDIFIRVMAMGVERVAGAGNRGGLRVFGRVSGGGGVMGGVFMVFHASRHNRYGYL